MIENEAYQVDTPFSSPYTTQGNHSNVRNTQIVSNVFFSSKVAQSCASSRRKSHRFHVGDSYLNPEELHAYCQGSDSIPVRIYEKDGVQNQDLQCYVYCILQAAGIINMHENLFISALMPGINFKNTLTYNFACGSLREYC